MKKHAKKNMILWSVTALAAIIYILAFILVNPVVDSGSVIAVIMEFVAIIASGTWLVVFMRVNRERFERHE